MKLSDLSYREYLAIEFLPAFMRHRMALGTTEENIADNTVRYAFLYADAFLRAVGKYHNEVAEANERTDRAETKASVLLNMGDDVPARVALMQIWEFIGVNNQTDAMEALRARRADRT